MLGSFWKAWIGQDQVRRSEQNKYVNRRITTRKIRDLFLGVWMQVIANTRYSFVDIAKFLWYINLSVWSYNPPTPTYFFIQQIFLLSRTPLTRKLSKSNFVCAMKMLWFKMLRRKMLNKLQKKTFETTKHCKIVVSITHLCQYFLVWRSLVLSLRF